MLRALERNFTSEEINTLCFDLGIDHVTIPGSSLKGKLRALLAYLERNNRVKHLVETCQEERPSFEWHRFLESDSRQQEQSERLRQLRELIVEKFDNSDLQGFCSHLNVDYDELSGATREAKARELILHCSRRASLGTLLNLCKNANPELPWDRYYLLLEWSDQLSKQQPTTYTIKVILHLNQDPNSSHEVLASLVKALTEKLNVEREEIRILGVEKGSVIITMELPEDAVQEMLFLLANGDATFTKLNITKMEVPQVIKPIILPSKRPIRVLFLGANPSETTRLRLDQEIRSIDEALRQSEFRDQFDIKQHWAVRVSDLQSCLLRYKPDIVHFSGHGNPLSEIILENEVGSGQSIPIHALSQLFSVLKRNVKCVVLNACYSEAQARAIAKHIPCVIGMGQAIGDAAAINFATSFYQALAYGEDVQTAFDLGCVQIDLDGLDESSTPKLVSIKCNPSQVFFVQNESQQ